MQAEHDGTGRAGERLDRGESSLRPALPEIDSGELLASFPEPMILYDAEMVIRFANAPAVESLGFDPTSLSIDAMRERIDLRSPESDDRAVDLDQADGERVARSTFYRFHDSAGRVHMALGSSAPLVRRGEVAGVVWTWIDITDRVRAEEMHAVAMDRLEDELVERTIELIESQELLEEISSSTHLLMAGLDTSFNYLRVNKTFAGALGRPPEFFPGRNHFDLFPCERTERRFEQALLSRRVLNAKQHALFRAERPDLFYDWSLHPVLGQDGEADELILVAVDVNLRMKAIDDLRKATEQIKQAKRLSDIGTLAATVAHELRNPLGVIRTAVYNIRRKSGDPALERHIANIEKKIDESSAIINNLLNYSRMQTPSLKRLRVGDIVSESITGARKRFRTHPAKISRNLRGLRGAFVKADVSQLRMVFDNVLVNALQAIEGDGEVRVRGTIGKDGAAVVEISDTGCGIEPQNLERIFDPFFTLKAKGTGLGLAVSSELLALNKGSISVRSKPGAGTTVKVKLPLDGRES